jgi:hypothetical protein
MNGRSADRRLDLRPPVVEELRAALPAVAERTVAALTTEVGEYSRPAIGTEMVDTIQGAVELALDTFLRVAIGRAGGDPSTGYAPVLEAAYRLGRGEARSGRTMEALLAAYRVGARIAWEEQSQLIVRRRVPAATVARFAQLVFAYIDELSSASAAGHRDELATSGRVREQLLQRLAQGMLTGEAPDRLAARAERAGWPTPATVTAVVLPTVHIGNTAGLLDPRTLRLNGDLAPGLPSDDLAVLLVPDVQRGRSALRAALSGRRAVLGPTRPGLDAHVSYERVLRALELLARTGDEPLDTEEHLIALVLTADREALHDLRATVLRPLDDLRPAVAERLTDTLRSWLVHQGRREDVAADLNVHPQTVRYRMSQIRDRFGARLGDPDTTLALMVALGTPDSPWLPSRR